MLAEAEFEVVQHLDGSFRVVVRDAFTLGSKGLVAIE
jgi:hypothetical protein